MHIFGHFDKENIFDFLLAFLYTNSFSEKGPKLKEKTLLEFFSYRVDAFSEES